jgi:hypothetical protein
VPTNTTSEYVAKKAEPYGFAIFGNGYHRLKMSFHFSAARG